MKSTDEETIREQRERNERAGSRSRRELCAIILNPCRNTVIPDTTTVGPNPSHLHNGHTDE